MAKKLLIIAIFILLIPTVIITANSIINDDMIRNINSDNVLNTDFDSSRFTQSDDLSINTIKGVSLKLKDDVSEEELELKNYDIKITTRANSILYFNEYLNIFKVLNKQTGYVWSTGCDVIKKEDASVATARSLASTIIMEYMIYNPNDDTYGTNVKSVELNSVLSGDTYKISPNKDVIVDTEDIEYGKKLRIHYKKIGIRINAYISLDKIGNLDIQVPDNEIEECLNDYKNYISTLKIAPALGSNVDGTVPGYFVIPDGSGSLIRYNQVSTTVSYWIPYYGNDIGINPTNVTTDNQYLSLPIFGIVNGIKQDGCLAVIESGDTACSLYINLNGAVNSKYNYLTPYFKLRNQYLLYGINQTTEDERIGTDIKVHYEFTSFNDSTYVGLANKYSDYLQENDLINKSSNGEFKLRIDALLSESVKALIGTKNVQMTKLSNLKEIINELESAGIENLTLLMLGWNSTGYSSTPPYKIKYNNKVASKKEFISFNNEQLNKGYQVYYYNDYVKAGEGGEFSKRNDVARSIQRLRLSYTWDANVYDEYHYLYPNKSETLLNDNLKTYEKLNISNLALDSIGTSLYTTYYKNVVSHTEKSKEIYQEMLNNLEENNMNIALYKPFAYLFKNLDTYLDMPLYSNQYSFYTDTVPFLPYVLRGVVDCYASYRNFFADGNEQMLRALDYGIYPSYMITSGESRQLKYTDSYYLYTTEYNHWKDDIINHYNKLRLGYEVMNNQKVIDRIVIDSGLIRVVYENNKSILINYKTNSYMVEGDNQEWITLN